ncbi:MAG: DUF1538 domain-containing protein [Defluviitaleaceae bacterium]|nr:DUF1538 domain-containing protein [Defluviitaleaceae bacterium]
MKLIKEKMKEVFFAVLPIMVLVVLLHLTLTPLETPVLLRFIFGGGLIIVGLAFFLIGVDIGITPLGSLSGAAIAKSNKLWIVIIAGLILGFFISIAEPGLIVLANQVEMVTGGLILGVAILVVVSVGMALMLALGFTRIVFNWPLHFVLIIFYVITGAFAIFASPEFMAIAFDASGATTGVLAVPFILALATGVAKLKKNSQSAEEDSFGLVAITSVGAIIAVLVMQIFSNVYEFSGDFEITTTASTGVLGPFIQMIPEVLRESVISLLPLLLMLLVLQKMAFKLKKRKFTKLIKGFIYTFIGLVIFLVGVNAGFMDVGTLIGQSLANLHRTRYLILVGFVLGVVTILAEPAVYVLTHQIEDLTNGSVKRKSVLIALALGVGVAIGLSMLRIVVPGIQLWHYLLPGYLISLGMTFFVPKLFVGMAFDAGGVATGPMTATFILAFTQGAAEARVGASLLIDGFGMIALVALTPIITLQILGFMFYLRQKKEFVRHAK